MSAKPEEERIRELAAAQLTGFMRWLSVAQLRLRCAEIVFSTGSQDHRAKLEEHAERLYQFAVKSPEVLGDGKKIDSGTKEA